jgi:membrane-bound inhibitor of C-type lysozyme
LAQLSPPAHSRGSGNPERLARISRPVAGFPLPRGRAGDFIGVKYALALATTASILGVMPAQAQTYVHYTCRNGAQFELALFPDTKFAFVQLDGKSLQLPKFVSVTGTRYRKDGITLWIRGNRATLRRAGKKTECTAQ